jgi:membrane protein implicated in regulation of membrane protease activity
MEGLAASVVLIAILLGVLFLVAFDLFCLVYLAAADRVGFLPKLGWAVVIVCISPFGGLVYLLSRHRAKRSPDHGVSADAAGGWPRF